MIIVVSGASGFIGSALSRAFARDGHEVRALVRRAPRLPTEIPWDVERGTIDSTRLEGVDAVVNLAGEPLAQRWTSGARKRIRDSRVNATTLLAGAIASLNARPRVLLSASAIGIYGSHRGDELLDESSSVGDDFLASVCVEWEGAADAARTAGVRVVSLRTGLVLSKGGGVLGKMLPPFKLGVGGKLGSGRQWMSCIALDDYVSLISFCLAQDSVTGPLNLVCPMPTTNAEFTATLGGVLHVPTVMRAPKFALTFVMGEMAEDTIFASQRVQPARARSAGFSFTYATLEAALRSALGDQ